MVGVRFGIGVHRNVALVEMADDTVLARTRFNLIFGDQHGHRSALRVIVLPRHIEDGGTDDVRDLGENLGQTLGVVGLVDVLDVLALVGRCACVGDVVNVERQAFRQVIESVKLELCRHYHTVLKFKCKPTSGATREVRFSTSATSSRQ